jgi:hypothetical protein
MSDGFEIEVKRFYAPGDFKVPCPKCGKVFDYADDSNYLSYPTANAWFDFNLYCGGDGGCEHEWTTRVKILCEVVVPDERIPEGGDNTDYTPSDLMRIAGAAWDVQHLLPHPDDASPEWAAALREFNRAIHKHAPLPAVKVPTPTRN